MTMNRLLLLSILAAAPLAPLACEGEPPINAPENTLAAPAAATVTSAAPAVAVTTAPTNTHEPPTSPVMPACAPPPCSPAPPASIAVPGASASSLESPSAAAGAAATPVVRGNVVGSLTTKPASAIGQAVVYLEDGPVEDAPSHLQTVTIDNRQMTFAPFVSVVAAGGKVVFANLDPFPHNVFSPDGEKFNMGNIPQNGAHVRIFKEPGAYSLLCNLHPGMLGYLLVTPSTWFAKSDAKGNFVMKHVPVGTYKATAWAPRQSPVTQPVIVGEGDVTIHFDLHR
jgi:plastocyanin